MTCDRGLFIDSTCDIGENKDKDMRHCNFLNLTCDIGENKRQGHATSRAPKLTLTEDILLVIAKMD